MNLILGSLKKDAERYKKLSEKPSRNQKQYAFNYANIMLEIKDLEKDLKKDIQKVKKMKQEVDTKSAENAVKKTDK